MMVIIEDNVLTSFACSSLRLTNRSMILVFSSLQRELKRNSRRFLVSLTLHNFMTGMASGYFKLTTYFSSSCGIVDNDGKAEYK